MTLFSIKNKIFPLVVLLLATTINSFSGMKKILLQDRVSISARSSDSSQGKQTDAETPQNTEEQENDDKVEDTTDDPFMIEYFVAGYINHQVNHIYEFQIALYHEQHRVIFSPPPEA